MKIWLPTIRAGTGADIYTERLAEGLMERGVDVIVTWLSHYLEITPYLMRVMPAPAGTDIIHVNSWNGFAFKRNNKKLVVTVHSCVHDKLLRPYKSFAQIIYHDLFIKRFETKSFLVADCVTAVSQYTADKVRENFDIEHANVIHNGIDTDFFSPAASRKPVGPFRLLFVGKPRRMKGFDLLEAVMQNLGDDFELYYTAEAGIKTAGKQNNMHATGFLQKEELLQSYRDCDALLFPSRLEGFGYTVCEAMACGKPVITSDNSSLAEIVRDGETGLLCKTDDVQAFCAAARKLAADRNLAAGMGKSARRHVLEHFSLDKMISKYIALYEELLAR